MLTHHSPRHKLCGHFSICFKIIASIHLSFLQFLYGQSIGGAVAIDLAYRNPQAVSKRLSHRSLPLLCAPPRATATETTTTQITALVIENTFMSLPRLIPTAMPLLGPFSLLCHQKWESYLKVTF
jgi:abhydrolase domain-containing protein 13